MSSSSGLTLANWNSFTTAFPPVQRRQNVQPPSPLDLEVDTDWSDKCKRLRILDLAQHVLDLQGSGGYLDLDKVVVLSVYHSLLTHSTKSPLLARNKVNLVKGQSGTGKSTLLVVYMTLLMKLGCPFIYSHGNNDKFFYWEESDCNVIVGRIQSDSNAFRDESVTWLMDQKPNGAWASARCKRVLITSENYTNYKTFLIQFATVINVLNMPLPSTADFAAVAAVHNIVKSEADEKLELYGPILSNLTLGFDAIEELLEEALRECNFQTDVSNSNAIIAGQEFSHRIFFFDADTNFNLRRRWFGSRYLEDRYNFQWAMNNAPTLRYFLHRSTEEVVQASAFTMFAHSQLITASSLKRKK